MIAVAVLIGALLGAVKGVRTALPIIDGGRSTSDALAVVIGVVLYGLIGAMIGAGAWVIVSNLDLSW